MANLLISGALGRMGQKVYEASKTSSLTAVCGVDIKEDFSNKNYKIYDNFNKVTEKIDVVIDFSSPLNLPALLDFCKSNGASVVLCTTGYTKEDLNLIEEAKEDIAIFRSANMSLGVNVLIKLVKNAAKSLLGYDIEIIEKHHKNKVDAPSGTALMLANGIKEELAEKVFIYGREGIVGKRTEEEIAIHAVRGGSIVGEHQVIFAGENETITLMHEATDRGVFASGAIKAAEFMIDKTRGMFNMNDILNVENA